MRKVLVTTGFCCAFAVAAIVFLDVRTSDPSTVRASEVSARPAAEPPEARSRSLLAAPESWGDPGPLLLDPALSFVSLSYYRDPAAARYGLPGDSAWMSPAEMDVFYYDPTAGGRTPLVPTTGTGERYLSPHLRLRDLAPRDGAAFARISPKLVRSLDRLMAVAPAPIYVSSGYRHPSRNFAPEVGGARYSQHMAGMAADIWSTDLTPGALAELALDAMGCEIGIGLGRTFVHVDVRGTLASWAVDDAAMSEPAFDAWVHARCAFWEAHADDPSLEPPPFADALAAYRAAQASPEDSTDALLDRYRYALTAYADARRRMGQEGAVVLDFSHAGGLRDSTASFEIYLLRAGSEQALRWNVEPLIRASLGTTYFVYVLVGRDGRRRVGGMTYGTYGAAGTRGRDSTATRTVAAADSTAQ